MSNFAAERDDLLLTLKRVKAQERDALWQDSILAELTSSGKVKVYRDNIQRVMTQYR